MWRFDKARNDSMDLAIRLVPDADILVCTDLDEVFLPGWRAALEKAWIGFALQHGGAYPNCAEYAYVWNFNPDGSDGMVIPYDKAHVPNRGIRWRHPVHEMLDYSGIGGKIRVRANGVRLEHHSAATGSNRQYLRMLELAVKENPSDPRDMHYLGREYFFRERYEDAMRMLTLHVKTPSAFKAERAESMRYLAKCCERLGNAKEQENWLWKAISEDRTRREPAMDLMYMAYAVKDWDLLARAGEACLSVTDRAGNYQVEEGSWGCSPWGLYALALWNLDRKAEAIMASRKAMSYPKVDKWVSTNNSFFKARIDTVRDVVSRGRHLGGGRPEGPVTKLPFSGMNTPGVPDDNSIIKWREHFDHIYCVHFIPDEERLPSIMEEFKRVGILDSGIFSFAFTTPDPWEDRFAKAFPDLLDRGHASSKGFMNLAWASIRTLREALGLGYRRILWLEDDIRFLKNLNDVEAGFRATPNTCHFAQYDKFMDNTSMTREEYLKMIEESSINDLFYDPRGRWFSSAACLMLDYDAMSRIVEYAERVAPDPLDAIPFRAGILKRDAAVVKRNLAIQIRLDKSMATEYLGTVRNTHHDRYRAQGIVYSDYNVPEGYGMDLDQSAGGGSPESAE